MRRLLLLGGTAEALGIAKALPSRHIYSLAGVGGPAPSDLNCQIRVGGFGGREGLRTFLHEDAITLVVDATHPYAAIISGHAADAAHDAGIPYWALTRPLWQPGPDDQWYFVSPEWHDLLNAIQRFKRPFFTLGRQPLDYLHLIFPHQRWFVRCLHDHTGTAQATVLSARGPFTLESEHKLFQRYDFDVLISKNSGSKATEPKLTVARERRIPVIMLNRPELPVADKTFEDTAEVLTALHEENYL